MTEYNPIVARKTQAAVKSGPVNLAKLQAHCDWLNQMNWVRYSNNPYYLREHKNPDGEKYMALDRKI